MNGDVIPGFTTTSLQSTFSAASAASACSPAIKLSIRGLRVAAKSRTEPIGAKLCENSRSNAKAGESDGDVGSVATSLENPVTGTVGGLELVGRVELVYRRRRRKKTIL